MNDEVKGLWETTMDTLKELLDYYLVRDMEIDETPTLKSCILDRKVEIH